MEDAITVFTIISTVMFFLIWEGIPVIMCLILAKKFEMPKVWCLMGLLGMFGIILMIVIGSVNKGKRIHSDYQGGDLDYQNNYENNAEYHTPETHWHNVAEEAGKKSDFQTNTVASWQPADDCKKKEDIVYVNGERMEREYVVCKNCGGKMRKGTNFCTFCGKDL